MRYYVALIGALCLGWAGAASGVDRVSFRQEKKEVRVDGRVVVTAQDGGLLLQGRDGTLWTVQPEDLIKRSSDETPFKPLSAEEFSKEVLRGLPDGFDVHRTTHYFLFYNTSRDYAQWCGSLFERLYLAFTNYWTQKGFELSEPEFPLAAIVFADQASYKQYARAEVGDLAGSIIGYYSLTSNRMTMYDLTGTAATSGRRRTGTRAQLMRMLAQPEAERTVATIVHEATHQIAFNCGLHTRLSDCPRWFSEGIAIYFETPDLNSAKGWSTIGGVNRVRLAGFRDYLGRRPADSLVTLLTDDKRFRDTATAQDAYAETWALTYFLLRQRTKEYVAYLKTLSRKKAMLWDDPETRLAEFKQAFGEDLRKLDAEFLKFMMRVR